jgi:crotonobetainyl-CoA:carnitine CoA-transferase CaiB-like acyl-CoA transferase
MVAPAVAPRLGQHTRAILQSLQVSDDDIAALAEQGVIQVEA